VNRRAVSKVALASLLGLLLPGCQLDYEVTVAAQNGQIVFNMVWNRLGPDLPATVKSLEVTEHSQRPRTVWEVESIDMNGRRLGRLQYGQLPQGFRQKVPPEQLKVGQLYDVTLWGLGGGDQAYFVVAEYDIRRGVTVLHK
jgi:hypothetical protein